jgi:bifunctional N-acetylglucosamine-1-phosphate-uridyltransferase/glucosamine-1-phosphate-acetyltransferase GlmU-like protein
MDKVRVIIPAAGKGKRLQPISGDVPKAMFKVGNRPMLEIVLENVSFADRDDTYIVVGCGKEMIIDHFKYGYHYVEQKEQLGTGHAVMECAPYFEGYDGCVLVTFGDMPLFRYDEMKKMCEEHLASGAACTLMTAENPDLTMWARVKRDLNGSFAAIVEGKDCNEEEKNIKELFSGVIVFDSKALFSLLPKLDRHNAQGEYYLTEVPELMVKEGMKVNTYKTRDGNDLRGINTPEDLEICEKILRERMAVLA